VSNLIEIKKLLRSKLTIGIQKCKLQHENVRGKQFITFLAVKYGDLSVK